MSARGTALAALFGLALGACTAAAPATAPAPRGGPTEAAITADDLRHRLEIVAHDSMEGREVGTRGMARATRYLAGELERIGLRPAGDDGTWYHRVALERTRFALTGAFRGPGGEIPLGVAELVPVNGIGGLPQSGRTRVEGPLAYGGWLVDPAAPAPEELRGDGLAGAVLVLRFGAAPGAVPGPGVTPRFDVQRLLAPGSPLAALVLVAEGELDEFWDYASRLARSGAVAHATEGADAPPDAPLVFLAAPAAVERMVGAPLDGARAAAGPGTMRVEVARTREPVDATNLVALLPGSDPARAGTYVALGAHHDHDGIGAPVDGDSIFNGADENGSGTVALLEIAERMAALPQTQRPARSVLFVWHTAEEKGLLGSEQFTDRPTVPRDSIVAHVNLDMIGRNHPDSLSVIGSRRLSTGLGDLLEAVNQRQPRPFAFDYSLDAPEHPERLYCRSDHYNYARFGIPVAFLTTGLHEDYHRASDTVEKVDYEKLARVTRLVADFAAEVAAGPERPRVDRPVPPLGAPCT